MRVKPSKRITKNFYMSAKLSSFIKSPFNYTGGKYRILDQIIPRMPMGIENFFDVFVGGGNVFINSIARSFFANDIDNNVISLFKFMCAHDFEDFLSECERVIKDFGLSSTSTYGYEFYGTSSNLGVSSFNKPGYELLKNHFNHQKDGYPREILFFVLICFGFNNQIRYNKSNFFNIPVGKRDLNENILSNLKKFTSRLRLIDINFQAKSFLDIDFSHLSKNDFVYFDPPYLISNASYNESGKWTTDHEIQLLSTLDLLISSNVKFGLSNMLSTKFVENTLLKTWITRNSSKLKLFNIFSNYTNSSYQKKNRHVSSDNEIFLIYSGT